MVDLIIKKTKNPIHPNHKNSAYTEFDIWGGETLI